jgi:hypothetical protein
MRYILSLFALAFAATLASAQCAPWCGCGCKARQGFGFPSVQQQPWIHYHFWGQQQFQPFPAVRDYPSQQRGFPGQFQRPFEFQPRREFDFQGPNLQFRLATRRGC